MMNPYEVYQTYLALKAHFKGQGFNYNTHGRTRTTPQSFESRKDRYYFEKMAKKFKKDDLVEFFVSQFVGKSDPWVGDMFSEEAEDLHRQRMRRVQALTNTIKTDIKKLWERSGENPERFHNLFIPKERGAYAPIFEAVIQKKISPETFLVLNDILDFTKSWVVANDPVWEEIGIPLIRYSPFLQLESRRGELKKIIAEVVRKDLHLSADDV
jgi:hypothetical protein